MNSISPDCQELKVKYDACFNKWFKEKFLRGQSDDTTCSALFDSYQSCVKVRHYLLAFIAKATNLLVRFKILSNKFQSKNKTYGL